MYWHFNRAGENMQAILDACIPADLPTTSHPDGKVYWKTGQSPDKYTHYRVQTPSSDGKRSIDEIPLEELSNAMTDILRDFHSLEEEVLFKETLRLFGFSAITTKSSKYLSAAFCNLKKIDI